MSKMGKVLNIHLKGFCNKRLPHSGGSNDTLILNIISLNLMALGSLGATVG